MTIEKLNLLDKFMCEAVIALLPARAGPITEELRLLARYGGKLSKGFKMLNGCGDWTRMKLDRIGYI